LALAASGFVLLLGAVSASAVPLPIFFLTLDGRDQGMVFPPLGATVYQLWMDPSAIAGGTFGFDWSIVGTREFRIIQ
jgi:hypothetical protein